MLRAVIFILIIFILIFILFQVKLPCSIEGVGRVLPLREVNLIYSSSGRLTVLLKDNLNGVVSASLIAQFERGDVASFRLNPVIKLGAYVKSGDTIGVIYSSEFERELVKLIGELQVEKAMLDFYRTGEKEELIAEAKERLNYAKEQAREQMKILRRMKLLYEKNLISAQEFELAQTTANLYNINVKIAEAQLKALQSGAKKEQIDVIMKKIKALEDEISVLRKMLSMLAVVSPVDGVVFRIASGDTLLSIADTTGYVVLIPVGLKDVGKIKSGGVVEVLANGVYYPGRIERIERVVRVFKGRQMFIAVARFRALKGRFFAGEILNYRIRCGRTNLYSYIGNFFKTILNL